jgi:hypothetical protein
MPGTDYYANWLIALNTARPNDHVAQNLAEKSHRSVTE